MWQFIKWFLINFIFCLIPVYLSWAIANEITLEIYLSFVSFSFTMLISSAYIFSKLEKPGIGWIFLTFFVAIVYMLLYIFYPHFENNLDIWVASFLYTNKYMVLILVLLCTAGLSLYLNRNSIRAASQDKEVEETQDKKQNMEKNFKGITQKLQEESVR